MWTRTDVEQAIKNTSCNSGYRILCYCTACNMSYTISPFFNLVPSLCTPGVYEIMEQTKKELFKSSGVDVTIAKVSYASYKGRFSETRYYCCTRTAVVLASGVAFIALGFLQLSRVAPLRFRFSNNTCCSALRSTQNTHMLKTHGISCWVSNRSLLHVVGWWGDG